MRTTKRGKSTSRELPPYHWFAVVNQGFNKAPRREAVSTAAMVYDDYIDWINESNMIISMTDIVIDEAPTFAATPTVTEFIEANALASALMKIDVISQALFGNEVEKPDLSIADDEVLGGYHLVVEVSVTGIEFEAYRPLRRAFDTEVLGQLDEDSLGQMVIMSRFDD